MLLNALEFNIERPSARQLVALPVRESGALVTECAQDEPKALC